MSRIPADGRPPRVALVLAGGGARGAYEIGALSILLPHLERRGERPDVIVGTSATRGGRPSAGILLIGARAG